MSNRICKLKLDSISEEILICEGGQLTHSPWWEWVDGEEEGRVFFGQGKGKV